MVAWGCTGTVAREMSSDPSDAGGADRGLWDLGLWDSPRALEGAGETVGEGRGRGHLRPFLAIWPEAMATIWGFLMRAIYNI